MNRLSIRMTKDAHEKAATIVYTSTTQKIPYLPDPEAMKEAREQAREKVKRRNAYNEHVKADLGIEFEFTYLGLQSSEHDPNWCGDTWKVTGKGDFTMTFRQGVGHRACFWGSSHAQRVTAFIVPPSAMDILYCVRLDNPRDESFENWCMEYGYDTDSRKAEKMYRACIEQTMMFRRNYPGVDLDEYEPLDNF